MLSYQHGYHAGNHADVLKHIVLCEILNYLQEKPKPICVIDTHAGAGAYSLKTKEALQTGEFTAGIAKLWPCLNQTAIPESVKQYLQLISEHNGHEKELMRYPGSPWFTKQLLTEHDRAFFYELHPKDAPKLMTMARGSRHLKVKQEDGFKAIVSVLPPKEKRGLVLVDPSYELKEDYEKVIHAVADGYQRFSSGTYAIWYPVIARKWILVMLRALSRTSMRNVLQIELAMDTDGVGKGMTASGMFVINPPWTLAAKMAETLPWLQQQLGATPQAKCIVKQIVPE